MYECGGLDLHSKWWVGATVLINREKTASGAKLDCFFGTSARGGQQSNP